MRGEPFTPEPEGDGQRVQFVNNWWRKLDAPYAPFARLVEENVRMLFSDQWLLWSPLAGRYIDLHDLMTEEERARKQRPTLNRLLPWFIITHARLTENQPILTFRPGPDRRDARLAEVADTIFKVEWDDQGMLENHDTLMAWLCPGGQAFLKSRIDPEAGELQPFRATAWLELPEPVPDPMTGELTHVLQVPDAPHDEAGNPLVEYDPASGQIVEKGDPFTMPEGGISTDVLSPLECRGTWDNQPWHKKQEHVHRTYLTPTQVKKMTGLNLEPDTFGAEATAAGELQRLMFGSGHYGTATGLYEEAGGQGSHIDAAREGLIQWTEYWHAPLDNPDLPKMKRVLTPDGRVIQPGGRLLVVTKNHCIFDDQRPANFRYTSPIRRYTFINLPGRMAGSTPQEALNPIQRLYNRTAAQRSEHVNLVANPIMVIDQLAGIEEDDITNEPGQRIIANPQQGIPPIQFAEPPNLPSDVASFQEFLLRELQELGNIPGSTGAPPTSDASGELVKELRFNSDRFLGATLRRAVVEYTRLAEDWLAWIEVLWDEEKVLHYTGEDNIARTVSVVPELFGGKVNIVPDLESMLPEGRGERQARVRTMWLEGAFGEPLSPEARRAYLELSRFPHMDRAAKPGGIHRVMAEQENGKLAKGVPAVAIPNFPWYDDLVHIEVLEEFMASPDYIALDPVVQEQFVLHWQAHHQTLIATIQQEMMKQAAGAMLGQPGMPGSAGFAGGKPSGALVAPQQGARGPGGAGPGAAPNGNGAAPAEPELMDPRAFLEGLVGGGPAGEPVAAGVEE